VVFKFLEENYPDCEIRYDQRLPDQNCSKSRPDALFPLLHRKLIMECDENSHKAATYSCDAERMSDLAAAGEVLPTVFIRYNPDRYRNPKGVTVKIPTEKRLATLKKEIDEWISVEKQQEHFITVVYLYYDLSERREQDFVPFDLSEMPQIEPSKEEENKC
jgi:hypothetical protein